MNPITKLFIILFFVLVGACGIFAQQGSNPFELTPRLGETAVFAEPTTPTTTSSNPFDLVAPTKTKAPAAAKKATRPTKIKKTISDENAFKRFLFISLMIILLLLTLLMTFLRPFFAKVYSAFGSDNMFNQVYRERENIGLLPFFLMYISFFLNAGLFAYLMLHHYKIGLPGSHLLGWVYCTLGIAGIFFVKHFVLSFIGFTFPIQREVRLYSFLIIVFAIVMGLILVPVNVLLAYGPENAAPYLLYFAWGTLALAYLFRYLRGLVIANRFVAFHKFHFLLYLCTVEIAPVFFLVKLVLNQI